MSMNTSYKQMYKSKHYHIIKKALETKIRKEIESETNNTDNCPTPIKEKSP